MRIGLLLMVGFFVLVPFLAPRVIERCGLAPLTARATKIVIGVLCVLAIVDLTLRLLGRPLFGH